MKTCIYRGTNEVGGNCIELATDTTRILTDVGMPLSSMEDKSPRDKDEYLKWLAGYKAPVRGAYADDDSTPVDAIFISHNHGDHYGLLPLINPKIPVYMSRTLKRILLEIEPLKGNRFDISHLDIREIEPGQTVQIGDMRVTAHAVDHAPAASAFEITDGTTRVVYTGDIRFHSNQSWKSWRLSDVAHAPDYLIMEGTRMSRTDEVDKYPTEMDVRAAFKELLASSGKLAFVSVSAQNLDRLCSLISACRSTRRSLVIKPYTAALMDIFHELAPKTIPAVDEVGDLRIYYGDRPGGINSRMEENGLLYKHKAKKISYKEIMENPAGYLVEHNVVLTNKLLEMGLTDYDFIYSMWHGYLTCQKTWDRFKEHLVEIHTSGHAAVPDLKAFVAKMAPKKIIPVHTECKDEFESQFGVPALVLNDNEIKEL